MTNEKIKIQLAEKEKTINTLQRAFSQVEPREQKAEHVEHLSAAPSLAAPPSGGSDTEAMHRALRDIANAVIDDADEDQVNNLV